MAWHESIGKKKDGLQGYVIFYYNGERYENGQLKKKQITAYGKDARDAALQEALDIEQHRRTVGTSDVSLGAYAQEWLTHAASDIGRDIGQATWDRYDGLINNYILRNLGDSTLMAEVTYQQLRKFVQHADMGRESKAKLVNLLKAMWRDARKLGYPNVDRGVADDVDVPKKTGEPERAPKVDMGKVRRLFAKADEVWTPVDNWRFSDVLKVYALSGARYSEGAGFQVPDWTGGKVLTAHRKRLRDGTVAEEGKGEASLPRDIPVEQELADALDRLATVPRLGNHPWLLTNRPWRGPAYPLDYKKLYKWLNRTVDALDDVDYTLHDLRHVAASRWVKAGADQLTVMKAGGWSSLTMVAKVYGHLWPKDIEELAGQLDGLDDEDLAA